MWWFIAYLVVTIAAAIFLRPETTSADTDVGTVETATADEGAVVPVVFGTVDLNSFNVVWYGDTKSVAIRSSSGKK